MKIFIDIGHPAHVHYFRNFIKIMEGKGHKFFISARDKDVTHSLLNHYHFKYTSRGKGRMSLAGKLFYLLEADYKILKLAKIFKPDIFLSFGSPYAAQVSKMLQKPHIAFDDTEHAKLEQMIYAPFTDVILSPSCFRKKLESKQIYFNGYMELCYLIKKYFEPDYNIKKEMGLNSSEDYIILRFVSWKATHDIGSKGIHLKNKIEAVQRFKKYAKVFISSETELPNELKKYRLKIPPHKMHDVLASSSLLFSESATMVSECAVLGIPSIYVDNNSRCYTKEEEKKYGLVYNYLESMNDQERAIVKGLELLTTSKIKEEWQKLREKMLADKIDVTAFMVWFVENYPVSINLIEKDPRLPDNFK